MESRRDKGREIYSEIMGAAQLVTRDATTNDFNRPLRVFTEETCFGDVWARPGLDRRTRSLLLIGMLTAMNRATELRAHVRGGISNGCTVREIQEVLYQCVVYCGLPAAVEGFRAAEEELDNLGLLNGLEPQ